DAVKTDSAQGGVDIFKTGAEAQQGRVRRRAEKLATRSRSVERNGEFFPVPGEIKRLRIVGRRRGTRRARQETTGISRHLSLSLKRGRHGLLAPTGRSTVSA